MSILQLNVALQSRQASLHVDSNRALGEAWAEFEYAGCDSVDCAFVRALAGSDADSAVANLK